MIDAYLDHIERAAKSGRKATATGRVSDADGCFQVEVTLETGETVWADVLMPMPGTFARRPTAGDPCVVKLLNGRASQAYVIGWVARPSSPIATLTDDGLRVTPPAGEPVFIEVEGGASIAIDGDEVTITAGRIKLGSASASMAVALAPLIEAKLTEFKQIYDLHTHLTTLPLFPAPGLGPTDTPLIPAPSPGNLGADKVNAE